MDSSDLLDMPMVNPNLYVTLTESVANGYIMGEDGTIIFSENGLDTLYYGE